MGTKKEGTNKRKCVVFPATQAIEMTKTNKANIPIRRYSCYAFIFVYVGKLFTMKMSLYVSCFFSFDGLCNQHYDLLGSVAWAKETMRFSQPRSKDCCSGKRRKKTWGEKQRNRQHWIVWVERFSTCSVYVSSYASPNMRVQSAYETSVFRWWKMLFIW